MRNLIITRKKSFVACLGTMKVYIEDPTSSDIVINGVPCRKLGTLKNGEEKTFPISENSAKVFVIAGKMSKKYCNEYYPVPAGDRDFYLNGKNEYNPATGNAFRFDGVIDEEVLKNRKKGTRRGIVVLIAALLVGILAGLTPMFIDMFSTPEPAEFSSNGVTVTLTDDFYEQKYDGITACYDSDDVAVFFIKDDFDAMEGLSDYTLEEYGELVMKNTGCDESVKLRTNGDLTYFMYEAVSDDTGENYVYYTFLFKTNDAFWIAQFTTFAENEDAYYQQFIDWANTIKFTNAI